MHKLEKSYGKKTYDAWVERRPDDLRPTQTDPDEANRNVWEVTSFRDLLKMVAFLGSMNKRSTLFYRGQTRDCPPLPQLLRRDWTGFGPACMGQKMKIEGNRAEYWKMLPRIGRKVFDICDGLGLPRKRGLENIREAQWAVIQHYGIWPTPLIDLTSSLRMAASFAMMPPSGSEDPRREGYVLVVSMPSSTASITFEVDENLCLARLSSACPPSAKRPHYQEGYLAGRFPIASIEEFNDEQIEKFSVAQRLVAKFKLIDGGAFWDKDFPIIGRDAVYPLGDELKSKFDAEFGPNSAGSVNAIAAPWQSISPSSPRT